MYVFYVGFWLILIFLFSSGKLLDPTAQLLSNMLKRSSGLWLSISKMEKRANCAYKRHSTIWIRLDGKSSQKKPGPSSHQVRFPQVSNFICLTRLPRPLLPLCYSLFLQMPLYCQVHDLQKHLPLSICHLFLPLQWLHQLWSYLWKVTSIAYNPSRLWMMFHLLIVLHH